MAYRKKTHKKSKAEVIDHKPDEKSADKPTAVRVVVDAVSYTHLTLPTNREV